MKSMRTAGMNLWSVLFLASLITGCASGFTNIANVKEGESFLRSPNGLLIGSVRWQQGEEIINPRVRLVGPFPGPMYGIYLKDIRTGHIYWLYPMKQPHFYLALAPGRYRLIEFEMRSIFSPFNITPGAKREHAARLGAEFLLAYGAHITTGGGGYVLSVPSPLPSFEIKEHEATYIGTVIVDLPDPIPDSPFTAKFIVKDEEEEVVKDLQARFPGIGKIEKCLLNDSKEREGPSDNSL